MTTIPSSEQRPAPADCHECNWSPNAAHPNVPGEQWEYVTFVDPNTWLCPACGMPNDAPDAPSSAPAEPDVFVIHPPAIPDGPPSDGVAVAADLTPDAVVTTDPAPESGSVPDVPEWAANPTPADDLVAEADDTEPAATADDLVSMTIGALSQINVAAVELSGSLVPQLIDSRPDTFVLVETLGAFVQALAGIGALAVQIAVHVSDVLSTAPGPPTELDEPAGD